MNKVSALVLALVLGFSVNVFAETGKIDGNINFNGKDYKSGEKYIAHVEKHKYTEDFTVNGQSFKAGTEWEAVQMEDGTWLPLHDAAGAVAGAGAGLTGAQVGLGALGVAAVIAIAGGGGGTITTVTP